MKQSCWGCKHCINDYFATGTMDCKKQDDMTEDEFENYYGDNGGENCPYYEEDTRDMTYDVTIDRNNYIGGSDIPIIMGISTFKKRYDLLLEKAGLKENDFTGNKYTIYGQNLEPKIRDYINKGQKKKFEPNRVIKDDLRCHSDGFNGAAILEIKTTSHIYDTVNEYNVYLVQLLLYMQMNEVKKGMLAVYHRPDDFNENFDATRLQVFEINIKEYKDLLEEINGEIERFRTDLKRLKENPLLSEEDFQPKEVIEISNKVLIFENQLAEYKELEKQYKTMKQQLFEAMQKYNIKSWRTVNGVKITRVDEVKPTITTGYEFDVEKCIAENPDIYKKYAKKIEKKNGGRSGYIKITLPQ